MQFLLRRALHASKGSDPVIEISVGLFKRKDSSHITCADPTALSDEPLINLGADSGGPGKRVGHLFVGLNGAVMVKRTTGSGVMPLQEFFIKGWG